MFSYDDQIAYLKENPDEIVSHWNQGKGIFKFVGEEINEDGIGKKQTLVHHGCLTMIRSGDHAVYINGVINDELTKKIKEDQRIPIRSKDVKVENLEAFKEYQELADSLIKPES